MRRCRGTFANTTSRSTPIHHKPSQAIPNSRGTCSNAYQTCWSTTCQITKHTKRCGPKSPTASPIGGGTSRSSETRLTCQKPTQENTQNRKMGIGLRTNVIKARNTTFKVYMRQRSSVQCDVFIGFSNLNEEGNTP